MHVTSLNMQVEESENTFSKFVNLDNIPLQIQMPSVCI